MYNFSLSLPLEYPLLKFMQIGFPKFVADLHSLDDDWKFSVPEIPAVPQLNSSTGQALRLQHNGGLVEFGSPNLEGHPIAILQAHQFRALPARERKSSPVSR